MRPTWQDMTWHQFGAAIDMLANAIRTCSEALWTEAGHGVAGFWYVAYHTLFWLDFNLSISSAEDFGPPAPFTLSELGDGLPDRVYTREELLGYLEHCRQKCRRAIEGMSDELAAQPCPGDLARYSGWRRYAELRDDFGYLSRRGLSQGELLLYNMRHVQHHAAQLNLLLRQGMDTAPRWVSRVAE